MIREILTYPDKKLKQRSKEVENFDHSLFTLLDDMYETMLHSGGVGLAAIQVGVPLNALIIELCDEEGNRISELLEIVNPKIVSKEGEIKHKEGCLSIPDFYEDVVRSQKVTMEYQNRNGEKLSIEAEDLLAIAIQHEIDHLHGRLFFERLSILKRKKFDKEYQAPAKIGKK